MCMKGEKKSGSLSRTSSRGSSPVSVSDSESSGESSHGSREETTARRSSRGEADSTDGRTATIATTTTLRSRLHNYNSNSQTTTTRRTTLRRSTSLHEAGLHVTAGTLVSAIVIAFALYFPFWLAPAAALSTYHLASYEYDAVTSHFDNTVWTYGTDYLLALSMLGLILAIPCHKDSVFDRAGWLSRGLLASYMISVTAGGLAHQFYTTVESQNTTSFRLLWTVCVGAVAAASGFMGATATELHCLDHGRGVELLVFANQRRLTLPVVPDWFWSAYAVTVTAIVVAGGFSFQRPACDIFVVGITQFPSTFYMMLILYAGLQKCDTVSKYMRVAGCCGFILNAPLLPMYPMLVQYTDWSLGSINTLLHTWLLVAWSLQGLTLRHVGYAVMKTEELADVTTDIILGRGNDAPVSFRHGDEVGAS